jgi:hypothetical protein
MSLSAGVDNTSSNSPLFYPLLVPLDILSSQSIKLNKQKGCWGAYTCSTTIIKLGAVLVGHRSVRLIVYLFPLGLKGFVLVVTHVTFVYGLTKHSTRVQIRYLTVSDLEFLSLDRRHRLKIISTSRCCPFKNWYWITDDRLRYQSCNRNRKWLSVRLCKDKVWKKCACD